MQTKRNVGLWILYDFANSIVFIVFLLYFSQSIVIDLGISDIFYNLTFTITAILLLLTVPITGMLLDKYWRRITGLRLTTILTAVFYGLSALFVISGNPIFSLTAFVLG